RFERRLERRGSVCDPGQLLFVALLLNVEQLNAELRAELAEQVHEVLHLLDDLALGRIVVVVRLLRQTAERLVSLVDDDGRWVPRVGQRGRELWRQRKLFRPRQIVPPVMLERPVVRADEQRDDQSRLQDGVRRRGVAPPGDQAQAGQ